MIPRLRLWQCDTIRHKRSPPAVRPAVHDDNTADNYTGCRSESVSNTIYWYSCTYNFTPEYLAALLLRHEPRLSLRSAGGLLLEVPRVNLEHFGRRAFACAGPTLWNKLPRNMRDNGNLAQFKKQLKTF